MDNVETVPQVVNERAEKASNPRVFEAWGDARMTEKHLACVVLALKGGIQVLQTWRKVVFKWHPRPISDQLEG